MVVILAVALSGLALANAARAGVSDPAAASGNPSQPIVLAQPVTPSAVSARPAPVLAARGGAEPLRPNDAQPHVLYFLAVGALLCWIGGRVVRV